MLFVNFRLAVDLASESVTVGVRYTGGAVSLANLNYFNLSYTRRLEVSQTGVKPFRVAELSRNVRLSGAAADQVVWDVTSPATPMAVRAARDGQALGWRADYATERTYITWSPSGTLPEPAVEGRVANQNLHALGQAGFGCVLLEYEQVAPDLNAACLHEDVVGEAYCAYEFSVLQ